MASTSLLQAVAVTAELCGRTFSEAAARVFVQDLAAYPEQAVIAALARCRKEVRGVLTVHDVVSRLDDGRPGPDEAWSMLPLDESQSAVWTDEMAAAFGVARRLLENGDKVGARMAFREKYAKLVNEARDKGKRVNWSPTLGEDPYGRWSVLETAVKEGRLPLQYAQQFEPNLRLPMSDEGLALIEGVIPRLTQ